MSSVAMQDPVYFGAVAEFETPAAIYAAAEKVTDAGYRRVDSHTPFAIHGIEKALKQGPSHLGWFCCIGGLVGIGLAQLMMYWMNAVDYEIWVSGKPPYAWESTIPITFELMVLLSAFVAVLGMLGVNRLPRLHHPIFTHSTIDRLTDDRFFLSIEASDPLFDQTKTVEFLREVGGSNVELLVE